jgi:hypothetical protein
MATTFRTRGLRRDAMMSPMDAPIETPRERNLSQIERLEEAFDRAREKGGVVPRLRNVRISMTGKIKRIDGKILGKVRHDLFEEIELGSKRMQKNERGALARFDVPDPARVGLQVLDLDIRRPR